MADWKKQCDYCREGQFSQNARISYQNSSMELPDKYAHSLLAHGARAMIATYLKSLPSHWENHFQRAYNVVINIYQQLGIHLQQKDLPQTAVNVIYLGPPANVPKPV